MARFLAAADKQALRDAIGRIEAQSAAEVVVSVRKSSGGYLHADLIAAAVAALGTLAFLLYSPWTFDLHWFLVHPLVAALAAGLLSSLLSPWRRLVTPARARASRARLVAEAMFTRKGMCNTKGRTGVLIFVSLLERRAEVLWDSGITAEIPAADLALAAAALDQAVAHGGTGAALAQAMEPLVELLGTALPRQADDEDEIRHEVVAS